MTDFDPISKVVDKQLTISDETVQQLNTFKSAEKFRDLPGTNTIDEKERLSAILDHLVDKLLAEVRIHPSKRWVLKQFQSALEATQMEDTEAKEHFGVELNKIMAILGIESSDGLINFYRYGELAYLLKQ